MSTQDQAEGRTYLSIRQAAFIGVGSMVGAGIFALLGAAGEVAGAAVWVSFLIAGAVALLQGYSFAKLGARYPTAGGLLEYVSKGFGDGHLTGITAWLTYLANAVVTAMVAVSFGDYASAAFTDENASWSKAFAVLIILLMTAVNVVGSTLVARAQTVIVYIVLSILVVFAVVTIVDMDPSLLAPSGYPPLRDIVSSVALTFFAFLGFGIITFTAKDLKRPSYQLPRAMFLALGIATTIYVAIALGVFGALPADEVVDAGATALAVAAQPSLGQAWIATVDGTPAGYLFAVFVFSLEYQGLTAEIDELYVMPQYRGLGLGTKLLANAEDAFRQGGCTVAFLQIGRDNDDARTFYRRHGYADRAGFELVDKKL